MAKQPKAKSSAGVRNDSRKNGKAAKKGTVKHRKTKLTEIEKILMGKGKAHSRNKPAANPIKLDIIKERQARKRDKVA